MSIVICSRVVLLLLSHNHHNPELLTNFDVRTSGLEVFNYKKWEKTNGGRSSRSKIWRPTSILSILRVLRLKSKLAFQVEWEGVLRSKVKLDIKVDRYLNGKFEFQLKCPLLVFVDLKGQFEFRPKCPLLVFVNLNVRIACRHKIFRPQRPISKQFFIYYLCFLLRNNEFLLLKGLHIYKSFFK